MKTLLLMLLLAFPAFAEISLEDQSLALYKMKMAAAAAKAKLHLKSTPAPGRDTYRVDLSSIPPGRTFYVRDGVWHRPEKMEVLKPGNHWHIGRDKEGGIVVVQHGGENFGSEAAHTDPSGVVRWTQSNSAFDKPIDPKDPKAKPQKHEINPKGSINFGSL